MTIAPHIPFNLVVEYEKCFVDIGHCKEKGLKRLTLQQKSAVMGGVAYWVLEVSAM